MKRKLVEKIIAFIRRNWDKLNSKVQWLIKELLGWSLVDAILSGAEWVYDRLMEFADWVIERIADLLGL